MLTYPNAKINLGLHVVEKRQDGYHNIETVFYPVKGLCDILEILPSKATQPAFTNTGLAVDAPTSSNLCVKAWELMHKAYNIPSVDIYLHKQIPFGAGLGGGSADAAQTLLMLNTLFAIGLNNEELKRYALELGSDCAFFIENKPMLGTGRGEVLEEIPLDLTGYFIALVKPNAAVSTAQAYSGIVPHKANMSLAGLANTPVRQWKGCLKNDFEEAIFKQYPEIADVKDCLYQSGAIYASMSGSGSSVFGIFEQKPDIGNQFEGYFTFVGRLGI